MRSSPLKWALLFVALILLSLSAGVVWFTAMPLRSYSGPLKPLTPGEKKIRDDLNRYVTELAGTIGERNLQHQEALDAAADYLLQTLGKSGYELKTYQYPVSGKFVKNIEVQVGGVSWPQKNLIVGAHYDTVAGSPGADDNATGVAALLELAQLLQTSRPGQTIRLVFFVNEEPPYFQTNNMGSVAYAKRLRSHNASVTGMISLETIGYYSDAKGSQKYPAGFGLLYPDAGNFIGFVGNTASRELVRRSIQAFRQSTDFPSEGLAAPGSVTGIGWSDHWAFWQQGYQGVMVTDTAPFRYPNYHRATDTPDKVDFEKMARVVEGLRKVILRLSQIN